MKVKAGRSLEEERRLFTYGYAALCSVGACILTAVIHPLVGLGLFELFQAAVVVSAWRGGAGPGLFSALLSFLMVDYFFIPPVNDWAFGPHLIRLVIFACVAVLTSLISGRLKRSTHELEMAHRELELRIERRTQQLQVANQNLQSEIASRLEAEKAILDISNREQRRLGQDLHDGLCQILTGVKFMVEGVRGTLKPAESKKLSVIESRLGEALSYVDAISRGLYPVELDTNGLTSALSELAVKTSRIYPVRCVYKGIPDLLFSDSAVATHLYRIAQEAVVNAVKGGRASRVNIRLFRSGEAVVLSVVDNGVGLGNATMRKGMGLQMMENRARVINATLAWRSRLRGGTLVRCELSGGESHGG